MAELVHPSAPELVPAPARPVAARTPRIEPRMDLPVAPAGATPWEDPPQPVTASVPDAAPAPAGPAEIIEIHARPAALWQRISAFIVDATLICSVLVLYVGTAAALITPRGVTPTQLSGIDGVMARVHQLNAVLAPCVALALVLGLVYTAVFALLWNGRTPGRRLLGIRLVDRTGLAPAPGRAIARAVLAVLSFLPFLAGFWLALFDRRGQTLHDKLTQTFVVRPG